MKTKIITVSLILAAVFTASCERIVNQPVYNTTLEPSFWSSTMPTEQDAIIPDFTESPDLSLLPEWAYANYDIESGQLSIQYKKSYLDLSGNKPLPGLPSYDFLQDYAFINELLIGVLLPPEPLPRIETLVIFCAADIPDFSLELLRNNPQITDIMIFPASSLSLIGADRMTSLERLSILGEADNSDNPIDKNISVDLSPLTSHQTLIELSLTGTKPIGLEILESCPKLTELDLVYILQQIELSQISNCGNLESLILDGTKFISLEPIKNMQSLKWITLGYYQWRDELSDEDREILENGKKEGRWTYHLWSEA